MYALENSSELERIACSQTYQIPYDDKCAKARALDRWMRSTILVDESKLERFRSGIYGQYRNSVETLQDGMGVCGEQAFLYMVLARNAGLDARFLLGRERGRVHALTRVYTSRSVVHVDHTTPYGFDRVINERDYQELDDEQAQALYLEYNGVDPSRHLVTQLNDCSHPCRREYQLGFRSHHGSPDPWVARAFALAACVMIPAVISFGADMKRAFAINNPVRIEYNAIRYFEEAKSRALHRFGESGVRGVELLKESYDMDGDRVLDRTEVQLLLDQVSKEVGR